MTVVVGGNAFDGLVLYGPFDDQESAREFAEDELRHTEWHVVELVNPEGMEA